MNICATYNSLGNSSGTQPDARTSETNGEFMDMGGERFYAIHNVDKLAPFFISLISDKDHWLFASSTGGLTAGRVSPETALFPYITVDRIHESTSHTGSKTLLRVDTGNQTCDWEPFNREQDDRFEVSRNLYKNLLGNKLCFEETNHDLQLSFRYTWATSDSHGFVRQCELQNIGNQNLSVEIIDGLQNILPAGTPRFTQTNTSNLVDAYKWTELDEPTGLAYFALYSGITDRAEPCEALKANTVFVLGLDEYKVLLSSEQLEAFRLGHDVHQESNKRGIRGAYLVNTRLLLPAQSSQCWQIIANLEQSQDQVVELRSQLKDPAKVMNNINESIDQGSDGLARIMASADGFQLTGEESVSAHHYANVMFNVLRGGIFDDQYQVSGRDFANTIRLFNQSVFLKHQDMLEALPEKIHFAELTANVKEQDDAQLERLCCEYLPITFGRRHGDPSRPWNQFAINLKDDNGDPLLSYQGNWRDIFQNWEALALSYPEFIENMIAKFVNASTMDGYNPYRITKEGIDWEVEEPDDPWSYIGYWGDHQIIYLQKLLEISNDFHPQKLGELLGKDIFCYANVPYRIRPFEALVEDGKNTVDYDDDLAERIEQRVADMGSDGKLVLDDNGNVYQVNLLEKLLVPLLGKLSNLVVDGGIWLNTQRPEWNDANNALVGQGLSMVTLYYVRRYINFMQQLLASQPGAGTVEVSSEVSDWLGRTAETLRKLRPLLPTDLTKASKGAEKISDELRYQTLTSLGQAASDYRQAVYEQESFNGKVSVPLDRVRTMLDDAQAAIDQSIKTNLREDGLYHAYNLVNLDSDSMDINQLYPMLEGQVAALSAGSVAPETAIKVLQALFESDVYRADQDSFMLYPDRQQTCFLDKNIVPTKEIETIDLVKKMLQQQDGRIIVLDADGRYRFNADLTNVGELNARLDAISEQYGQIVESARLPLQGIYEQVFNHQAFTGRSGGMFGFEGLGCIYWHMVSKLLLAVEETFHTARDQGANEETCQQIGQLYYRVRQGIGFNKTPQEYGAFPTDPYSHTPKHAGAQQPGMTGQVKEEMVARFGELGVRIKQGAVHFEPRLLREQEFLSKPEAFRYLDVQDKWQEIAVPEAGLAFTWCQIPIIYQLDEGLDPSLVITWDNGERERFDELTLDADKSAQIFLRTGLIRKISLTFGRNQLLQVNKSA